MSLKKLRKEKKLTQEELAEKLDMSPHAISSIERGINFPSAKTLDKINDVFNLKETGFYNLSSNKENNNRRECINDVINLLHKLDDRNLLIVRTLTILLNEN